MRKDTRRLDQPVSSWQLYAVVLLVCGAVLFIAFNPFITVGAGKRGIVLTWGKVEDRILGEGLHTRIPVVQRIVKMSVRTQKHDVETMSAATKDMQDLYIQFSVNYHLDPTQVNDLFKNTGTNYDSIIVAPSVQQIVKQNTVKFEAENTMAHREELRQNIEADLSERLSQYGIIVEYVHIENIDFNEEFRYAIERKATAAQNLLAEGRELEIMKVQAQQQIEQARGEAEALLLDAEAKAKALGLQKQQITSELTEYKAIEKWNGVMPQYTCGAVPFLDVGGV